MSCLDFVAREELLLKEIGFFLPNDLTTLVMSYDEFELVHSSRIELPKGCWFVDYIKNNLYWSKPVDKRHRKLMCNKQEVTTIYNDSYYVNEVDEDWVVIRGPYNSFLWNSCTLKKIKLREVCNPQVHDKKVFYCKNYTLWMCDPKTKKSTMVDHRKIIQSIMRIGDCLAIMYVRRMYGLWKETITPQKCVGIYKWNNQFYKVTQDAFVGPFKTHTLNDAAFEVQGKGHILSILCYGRTHYVWDLKHDRVCRYHCRFHVSRTYDLQIVYQDEGAHYVCQ